MNAPIAQEGPAATIAPLYEYTFRRKRVAEAPASVHSPLDVLPVLRRLFEGVETEELKVLALDTHNHVIGADTVYRGNVAGTSVRVAECFRFAVRMNAAAVIIAHNHPSGDPEPSAADVHVTGEFVQAGKILDIAVMDHIVVGHGDRFVSLRAEGQLS